MKCTICQKGKMEKMTGIMEKDGIEYEAYKCNRCGEEIMTMDQLEVLAEKYRKLRKSKEVTFARWGNSLAVRIPRDIASEYNLTEGKHGILTKDREGIKIIPS